MTGVQGLASALVAQRLADTMVDALLALANEDRCRATLTEREQVLAERSAARRIQAIEEEERGL